jgi:geranylgeranyl pyrophosphate synthase
MLTRCCTQTGALLGPDAPTCVEALGRYGHATGLAFQIVDDILDITGESEILGKPVGGDLREAKITLPTIYALHRADSTDRRRLEECLLIAARLTDADIAEIRTTIERYDGFGAARAMARQEVALALDALATLPPSAARDALADLAERIVERDR